VSGAFGMFQRDAVITVGGYRTGTVGEDTELVVRLHRACRRARRPYRIVYLPDPVLDRSPGKPAHPALLLFDILGPILELSGYLVTLVSFLLGLISPEAFLLFLALAVRYGLILTLGAAVLEDATTNRHPS
jgi:hypothetical protein